MAILHYTSDKECEDNLFNIITYKCKRKEIYFSERMVINEKVIKYMNDLLNKYQYDKVHFKTTKSPWWKIWK